MDCIHNVTRHDNETVIDAVWDKPLWRDQKPLVIGNYMGDIPGFRPFTEARIMYGSDHIYVIFRVKDRYVICNNTNINDPVWQDSCVEFFFAPDINLPERYFNLEVNCGGTALMHYNILPRRQFVKIDPDDIAGIEIAHSLPEIVSPELKDPVTWTVEYKIPVKMLRKYSNITLPEKGVIWKANLYKIAVNSSNPHYMTWSPVENQKPDFHLPLYFGQLVFN